MDKLKLAAMRIGQDTMARLEDGRWRDTPGK